MITVVNSANSDQYRILYDKATRDLLTHDLDGQPIEGAGNPNAALVPTVADFNGEDEYAPYTYYRYNSEKKVYELAAETEPAVGTAYYKAKDITSLNEYFSYIEALARINPVYTVLPLNEPVFEIDANTRKIDVPEEFQKNGISVQGDEIAEIIYFKINRFYDAIDLATKDIYIQWKSAALDGDGNQKEGVSVPWCVDLKSAPNYIIFGWPISSKITESAGQITFAVRFFEFESGTQKLTYSLATLPQTVQIKPSLDFNILDRLLANNGLAESDLIFDDNSLLIVNRLEDSIVIDSEIEAEEPYFLTGGDLPTEAWLDRGTDGFLSKPIDVDVMASSDDGGRITYIWTKTNEIGLELPMTYGNTYKPTEDTTRHEEKTYYIKISSVGSDDAYAVYDGVSATFDPGSENYPDGGIFEKFSTGHIDSVGNYQVTVTNRVQNSTKKIKSVLMVVKKPLTPIIQTDLTASGWLLASEDYKLTIGVNATTEDRGDLTYQWYVKKPSDDFEEEVLIEGATDATYEIVGSDQEDAQNGAEGDGLYYVIVTNHMNNEVAPITSSAIRVTHEASKPTVIVSGPTSFNQREAAEQGIRVQYSIGETSGEQAQRIEGVDTITYQWYRYITGPESNTETDVIAAQNGTYVPDHDLPLEEYEAEFYPTAVGLYYCVVTNTYNGTTASQTSKFFNITEATTD